MKLTYIKEHAIAYLALKEIQPAEVREQVKFTDEILGTVIFDLDDEDFIIGIEFVDVATQLHPELLRLHEV